MVSEHEPLHKVALEPWEVGGELLDILSRGLYSDVKDAVREYVQNGVDAEASKVLITVSGPRVTIRDDGTGMDYETLRRARRFGVSDKRPKVHVGYRGIGMYAAFGMCETLQVSTRRAGMEELFHLQLNFGQMRQTLETARTAQQRIDVALANLLYEHATFHSEIYTGLQSDHFTIITLQGIGSEYRAQINDIGALSTYLLRTIPVAFPEEGYGPTVNDWLKEYGGISPVTVALRVGNEPEIAIQPQVVPQVESPAYEWLEGAEGKPLAFMWYALTTEGSRIPSISGEAEGPSGYLLKLKGFTLGDRSLLKHLWPAVGGRTLYHHYTGEIHVLEASHVYPNAARNNLETGPHTQILLKHFSDLFRDLNGRANLAREILKVQKKMGGVRDQIASLEKRFASEDEDAFELYRSSKNLLESLEITEKEVPKLSRGRRAIKPTTKQRDDLDSLAADLKGFKAQVTKLIQRASQRTEGRRRTPRRRTSVPPTQGVLLEGALDALKEVVHCLP